MMNTPSERPAEGPSGSASRQDQPSAAPLESSAEADRSLCRDSAPMPGEAFGSSLEADDAELAPELTPELEEAWLAALDGEAVDADQASALASYVKHESAETLWADAELDGLLAARGDGRSGAGSEFWVESVLRRAEREGLVRSSGRGSGPTRPAPGPGVSATGRAAAGWVVAFLAGVGTASAVFLGGLVPFGATGVRGEGSQPAGVELVELRAGAPEASDVTVWTDEQGRRFLVARRRVGAPRPMGPGGLASATTLSGSHNLILHEDGAGRSGAGRSGSGRPGTVLRGGRGPSMTVRMPEREEGDTTATVATLLPLGACRWEDDESPGLRVGTRRLGLVNGAARVRFDSGALVELEAPARMDILSSNRVVLWRGRAMAKVPQDLDFALVTPGAPLHPPGSSVVVQVADDGGTAAATWRRNGGYEGLVSINGQARRFARPVEFATAARRVVPDLEAGRGRAFVDVRYFSLREVPKLKLDVRLANRRWKLEGGRDVLALPEDLRRSMRLTPTRETQRFHAIIRVDGQELTTRSPRDLERLQAAVRALPNEAELAQEILRRHEAQARGTRAEESRREVEVEVEIRPDAPGVWKPVRRRDDRPPDEPGRRDSSGRAEEF